MTDPTCAPYLPVPGRPAWVVELEARERARAAKSNPIGRFPVADSREAKERAQRERTARGGGGADEPGAAG